MARGALDWLPPDQRVLAAKLRGRSLLRKGDYFQAYRAFLQADASAAGADRELVRGLVHLAAAGEKRRRGDVRGAARQLAHARRRLAPFRPVHGGLDLDELLRLVD